MYENLIIICWIGVCVSLIKWYLKFIEVKKEITQLNDDEYIDGYIKFLREDNEK